MKIVILGAGQVGSTLTESLCAEHDVTVIDNNPQAIDKLRNKFDVQAICGQAILPEVLKQAGLAEADMLIAVTNNDESNILACQMAYFMFKTPIKIARVKHVELQHFNDFFDEAHQPIDLMIDPAALVTAQIEEQIRHPLCSRIWSFTDDKTLRIAALAVSPLSKLNKARASDIEHWLQEGNLHAKLIGLMRNQRILFPAEISHLESYDQILICCTATDLNKVGRVLLDNSHESVNHLMIAGGGRIGSSLAVSLEKDCAIKLIEVSHEHSQKAADVVNHSLVLLGDATDVDLLKQEGIADMDLFCSVTNEDDVNIMSAILAKRLGAKYTIALVNQQRYAHYLSERSPDIDITISPQYITGSKILRMLYKKSFNNIYPIFHGAGHLLEVICKSNNPLFKPMLGKKFSQLRMPKSYHLAGVYRNGKLLLDLNTFSLAEGDHLILLLRDKKDLNFFTALEDHASWA